jgi:hypothetical protein
LLLSTGGSDGRWRLPVRPTVSTIEAAVLVGLRPAIRMGRTMFSAAVMVGKVERLEDEAVGRDAAG